jgi:hypothetical protein
MKFLKSSWGICLLAVGSFMLGAWLFHVRTVKASPQTTQLVRITSVFMSGPSVRNSSVGGAIVGFSCVSDTTNPSGLTGNGVCYIASVDK